MRYLLLSDIHANLVALEAVLSHARRKRWDKVIFLGDAVGYYPQPNEVVDLLRELEPDIGIVGNHEDSLLNHAFGQAPSHREQDVVTDIILRHLAQISEANLAYLKSLDTQVVREAWQVAHGGLRTPWEYVTTLQTAQENAPYMETDLCFVGHTHVPKVFARVCAPSGDLWRAVALQGEHTVYRIPPKAQVLFNPGSVGQPRDGVPLASYVIFDEEHRVLEHFRVEYDVLRVQRLVRDHGYPETLATRLALGR